MSGLEATTSRAAPSRLAWRSLLNAFVYYASTFLNQGLSLLLVPFLTRHLSPAEYGQLGIYTAVVSVLVASVGMAVPIHVSRNFFQVTKPVLAGIVANLFAAIGANTLIAGVIVAIALTVRPDLVTLAWVWVAVALIQAATDNLFQLQQTVQRHAGKSLTFALFQSSNVLLNVGLSVALVSAGLGWQGRALGLAGSSLVFALVALFTLRRAAYCQGWPTLKILAPIYTISLPLVPHALAAVAVPMASRFLIDKLAGREAVGLFLLGTTIGSVVAMVAYAANLAWAPWVYQSLASDTRRSQQRIVQSTWALGTGFLVVAGVLAFMAPFIVRIIAGTRFAGASSFVFPLAFSGFFQAAYALVYPYFVQAGRTSNLALITFGTAALGLGMNYLMIVRFGPIGAAYSELAASAVKFGAVALFAQRIHPMPWISGLRNARACWTEE